MSDELRLNLGAGDTEITGYVSIDRKNGKEIFPLDYPDNSADTIRCSHALEHFGHQQTRAVMADWARVLKPGGELKIAVPDFSYIAAAYTQGRETAHPLEMYVMGGHTDENDHHGAIFTERKLRNLFHSVGLTHVHRWHSEIPDCAYLPVSLNLMGRKPRPVDLKGVHAIQSLPRYGLTSTASMVTRALGALKIPLREGHGVFWGEVLTASMQEAIDEGYDYVLTIDYDSVFNPEDVRELFRLMEDHPEAGAICALQMRRGNPAALIVLKDEEGKNLSKVPIATFDSELTECESAHFGLTMIRSSVLKALSKPWFQAVADVEGTWHKDGYVASDVAFWRKFTGEGHKLYQANQVAIGHIQETIIWPTRNLTPVWQEITDYRKDGMPEEALR